MTYGNEAHEPCNYWTIRRILRNNEGIWQLSDLIAGFEGRTGADLVFKCIEDAQAWAQLAENNLRAKLGEGLPPVPAPQAETPPLIVDEDGFARTTRVKSHWSRNGGRLYFTRVWKQVAGILEQDREVTDPEEERILFRGYFKQRMIEEAVTRMVTGGFGRLIWQEPFMTVTMQCELDFVNVSSMTAVIRLGTPHQEEIAIPAPTTAEIMKVVARQMAERKRQMDEKIGDRDERELYAEIERSAKLLGMDFSPPTAASGEGGRILPIELEDIQRGGGDVLDPGQKKGAGL